MAKTMIKYENGLNWIHENTTYKGKDIDLYQLLDKNGENQGDIMSKGESARINMHKDEYLPFAENILNELKPEIILGVDYAVSNDGDYYLGLDSIKQASEEGVKFDKVSISGIRENNALSNDGRLYLGEDAIKSIPEDVVLKNVNIQNSKNITEWNRPVIGYFNAKGSNLTTIGPNAEFGGYVDISRCKNITEFNNKIPDTLYASDSGLTTIGPDAEFGGNIWIENCNITEFNHKVEGTLFAEK
ncbi:hypothetical protein [Komagataeibacter nataicola]|uniref:hypothetical protein n=1 Tax=Komagataeibacter nataicola TaxID=265960 RepID=UPI00125CF750|nr:hypothetical protein [Komagataeibacter nataicola]